MQVTIKTDNDSLVQMFAVEPKRDCPHIKQDFILKTDQTLLTLQKHIFEQPCKICDDKAENWICLWCNEIYCSRYVNAHMAEHCTKENHMTALSLIDLSFWCYECNSYITNLDLDKLRVKFSNLKFNSIDDVETLADQLSLINLGNKDKAPEVIQKINESKTNEESKIDDKEIKVEEVKKDEKEQFKEIEKPIEKFTYEQLIEGIKSKQFKSIAFLTGAGISVAAGIPDFRTPGTGLYSKLEKYNLNYPEQIFDINFFLENPKPFYEVSKEFLMMNVKPTRAHYFQVLLQKRNQLLISMTQNIDGLELDAGLDAKFLVQAHGHYRTGHCVKCQKGIDMTVFKKHLKDETIMKCECDGLCKPDIVFFGEGLPKEFFARIAELKSADLAFVMGTGLAVAPFNVFVDKYLKNVPLVCINNNQPDQLNSYKQLLFLQGDIEENIEKILKDCNLVSELNK